MTTLGLVGGLIGSLVGIGASEVSASAASSPTVSVKAFTNNFAAMKTLTSVTKAGKGKVAVILPDTVSSARYTQFDDPYLTKALETAGLPASEFSVQNAQGSDTTQLTDAQSAIAGGASVLVVDPLDSGVGASIETYAKSHGVAVIDYDRLTLGGSRQYYVSFNNVNVGTLMGNGLVSCAAAWKVSKPNVAVMVGSPTDNNATLFAQGYNAVLNPKFKSGSWTLAVRPAGTWDPPTAETEFQQALTAHPGMNAVLVPNDENAAPIITYLKTLNIPAQKFPVTGQDATTVGVQNVISGYQCGTVYKPIYVEAQAAAALAIYLRAGQTPPSGLVNGTSTDTVTGAKVRSSLLTPQWVTPTNVESTVVKDQFVTAAEICTGAFAADCTKYGIK